MSKMYRVNPQYYLSIVTESSMSSKLRERAMVYGAAESYENIMKSTNTSKPSVFAVSYRMLEFITSVIDRDESLLNGDVYGALFNILNSRAQLVVLRENCRTVDEVRRLLSNPFIAGMGDTTRKEIGVRLKEIEKYAV